MKFWQNLQKSATNNSKICFPTRNWLQRPISAGISVRSDWSECRTGLVEDEVNAILRLRDAPIPLRARLLLHRGPGVAWKSWPKTFFKFGENFCRGTWRLQHVRMKLTERVQQADVHQQFGGRPLKGPAAVNIPNKKWRKIIEMMKLPKCFWAKYKYLFMFSSIFHSLCLLRPIQMRRTVEIARDNQLKTVGDMEYGGNIW